MRIKEEEEMERGELGWKTIRRRFNGECEVNQGEDSSASFDEDERVDFGDEEGWTLLPLFCVH